MGPDFPLGCVVTSANRNAGAARKAIRAVCNKLREVMDLLGGIIIHHRRSATVFYLFLFQKYAPKPATPAAINAAGMRFRFTQFCRLKELALSLNIPRAA